MLPDPLNVSPTFVVGPSATKNISLALNDLSPGKTVRIGKIGGNNATLTISNVTNGKANLTKVDRISVKLEQDILLATSGETVTASAQAIFALPRAGMTNAQMKDLFGSLLSIFLYDNAGAGNTTFLDRIIAREP